MYMIVVAILGLGMMSCSDFLELYPKTSLNEGNFYKSDNEFVLMANGAYVPLRTLSRRDHVQITELKSDNLRIQSSHLAGWLDLDVIESFQATSGNTIYESFWNTSYNGIYRCNVAMESILNSSYVWSNPSLKNRSLGEAYFLRALYYFNLVRQFGGVPLVLKKMPGVDAVEVKRASVDDTYKQIIADLETAIDYLSQSRDVEENGRVNMGAAQTLLGKVYLTVKNYPEAEKILAVVIASGQFRLRDKYAEVFNPAAKDYTETIFSIQYSESAADLAQSFIFYHAPYRSGGEVTQRPNVALNTSGMMQPTTEMLRAYEEGDERYEVSIGWWTGLNNLGVIADLPYAAKYKPPQTATLGWCGDNFPVLRYADVLLMYAEALNAQNRTQEAIPYLAQVRQRAGLSTGTISSREEFALILEKERQVEFFDENQRWYDLVRTDRAIAVMRAQGKTVQDYHVLSPIPGQQVLINQITQNTGYGGD